jgi:glutaredoxin-like YruB-family protein
MEKEGHHIKIYSTPTCPYCHMLKEYLAEKGFAYEDVNVAQDVLARKEMIEKSGQMGVPVSDIDGKIVVGFAKDRVNELLGIKD